MILQHQRTETISSPFPDRDIKDQFINIVTDFQFSPFSSDNCQCANSPLLRKEMLVPFCNHPKPKRHLPRLRPSRPFRFPCVTSYLYHGAHTCSDSHSMLLSHMIQQFVAAIKSISSFATTPRYGTRMRWYTMNSIMATKVADAVEACAAVRVGAIETIVGVVDRKCGCCLGGNKRRKKQRSK